MSDPILLRLVWKEYRAQRAFWVAVAVLGLLCQLTVTAMGRLGWLMFDGRSDTSAAGLFGAALLFAALYALGALPRFFQPSATREPSSVSAPWRRRRVGW